MALLFAAAAPPVDPCNDKIKVAEHLGEAGYQQRRGPDEGDPYCEGQFLQDVSGQEKFAVIEYTVTPRAPLTGEAWSINWPYDERPVRIHIETHNPENRYALDGAESTPGPDDEASMTDNFLWDTTFFVGRFGAETEIAVCAYALDESTNGDRIDARILHLPAYITDPTTSVEASIVDLKARIWIRSSVSVYVRRVELQSLSTRYARTYTPRFSKRSVTDAKPYWFTIEFGDDHLPIDGSTWRVILTYSESFADEEEKFSDPLYITMPTSSFLKRVRSND